MDQNNPQPVDETTQPTESVTSPIMTTPPAAKSDNKILLRMLLIIAGILIVSVVGYFTYSYFNTNSQKDNKSTNLDTNKIEAQETTINPAVEAANSILTGSSISESSLTSTDDSLILDETSNAAGNIGDSIDENSF